MSINPLNNYISGSEGPLSTESLVVDDVYAVRGVIDTVARQKVNYQDPNSNQINIAVPLTLPPINKKTTWSSARTLNDENNTFYSFQLNFSQTTYVNLIEFDITSVPLQWSLYYGPNAVDSALITTGIISQYSTTSTVHIRQLFDTTYEFDVATPLTLLVAKLPTGTSYGVSISNFSIKLDVEDQDNVTVNGSVIPGMVATNRLGFVEQFVPSGYNVSNIIDSDVTTFWKSSPQPVSDAIVSFTVDLATLNEYPATVSGTALLNGFSGPVDGTSSIALSPQRTITNASGNGTSIVYTYSGGTNAFAVNQNVTTSGISPASYNLTNVAITAATTSGFTIANSGIGTYVSGGFVTGSGYVSTTYTPTTSQHDFSIAAWYQVTTTGTNQVIADTRSTGSNSGWYLQISSASKQMQFTMNGSTTKVTSNPSNSEIPDGNWHFVVGTVSGNTMTLYKDGVQVDTDVFTAWPATGGNLDIGARAYTPTNYFNGGLAHVAYFNSALTSGQISEMYNSINDNYSNLVLSYDPEVYYKLDDTTTSMYDSAIAPVSKLKTLNRMYLDPLYTDTVFNLYYSYDADYWYPVQRDFRLRKGIYELPTINTRYLKFEFTQLTAEPYQLSKDSVDRTVQVFPTWVDSYFTTLEHAIPDIANQTYDQSNRVTPNSDYVSNINSQTIYGNAVNNLSLGWSAGASLPDINNSSRITDPTISYKTVINQGSKGAVFNPITDTSFIVRRFPYAGTHEYKNVNITQTWNHAYFTGLKNLLLFNNNYNVQIDYPEFTDYLLGSGTNSIIASGTATFNPVVYTNVSGVIGGGYVGGVGSTLYTKSLNTITQYNGFKFAALSTDWQAFNPDLISLSATSFNALGITSTDCTGTVFTNGNGYNIFQVVSSSGVGSSSLESARAGSTNLLTTSEANFVLTSGWTTITGATTITYSGVTPVTLNNNSTSPWNSALGNSLYGSTALGSPSRVANAANNSYTFLFTASGPSASVIPVVSYSGSSGVTTYSGTTTTITGSQQVKWVTQQPTNTTRVDFTIVTSGNPTLSQGGYFLGNTSIYTSPIRTLGMRFSATARIFLPDSNWGTYRVSIIGYKSDGSGSTELAAKQFSSLPLQTWMDLEVPFTLTNNAIDYGSFTAKITQTSSIIENYQIALFGIFYNPLTFEYTTSNGSQWNYVVNGVNDPDALIAFNSDSNQVQFKATFLQDNTTLSALSIIPNYTQSPFYSTTPIQYIGDSKTNELSWRRSPNQRPLFQLPHQLHPAQYDIAVMMGIFNSYYPS